MKSNQKRKQEAVGPSTSLIDDDVEGTKRHITELCDEWKKKVKSKDKAKSPDRLVCLPQVSQ